ncbi:hypothetical protein [Curtobacterium sp. L1-20]|uniref:hypothetical protein n=1 Tax=Curtobacterium sp. L1-20 TaxID=3138181 RepID=UPI003B520E41
MAFGYRIFQVGVGKRQKPDVRFNFDNVGLHSNGALGLFEEALRSLVVSGNSDVHRSTYFTVDSAQAGGWLFRISASGGQFGRPRRVRDTTTGVEQTPIDSNHAVLDDLPMLLVVPDHGQQGLLVAACEGRSHNAFNLQRVIETKLKAKNLTMPLVSDLADAAAWQGFLNQTDIDVRHVELVQSALDPTRPTFGQAANVTRATVRLTIANAATKANVLSRVKAKVLNNRPLNLTGALGMTLSDGDFDDYRVVYVQNGREKTLSVATDYPHFIYPLDGPTAPTVDDLLAASAPEVEHLMTEMGINHPTNWADAGGALRSL